MLFLFIVILIHSKYPKFRKGIYSIIFACIISEYIYSLIYFIHGLDFLTFKVLQTNDTVCDVFSFFGIFLFTNLIVFNSLLIINLLLNRIPAALTEKDKRKSLYQSNLNDSLLNIGQFSFLRLHLVTYLISISSAVYVYLTDNLGRSRSGQCFLKDHSNNFAILQVVSFMSLWSFFVLFVLAWCQKYVAWCQRCVT